MSYSNTIGPYIPGVTKLSFPLEFPDGTVQTTASDGHDSVSIARTVNGTGSINIPPNTVTNFDLIAPNYNIPPNSTVLVSGSWSITNNDTANVDFATIILNFLTSSVTVVASTATPAVQIVPGGTIADTFSVVVRNGNPTVPLPLDAQLTTNVSTVAYTTSPAVIGFETLYIVKLI